MFNIWPFNTSQNIIDSMPKCDWLSNTGYTIDGKFYTPAELMNEFIKLKDKSDVLYQGPSYVQAQQDMIDELIKENKKFKNEASSLAQGVMNGIDEINNIKLMSEERDNKWRTFNRGLHAQIKGLKEENEKLELRLVAYQKITEGGADSIDDLNKEVINLRHLKQENVELIDKIRQLEVANERWQSRFQTFENMEKQIISNDYAKCAEQRDEFKHQLNAANKEIKALKDDITNYVIEKSDELNEANKTIEILKNLPTQGFEEYDSKDFVQKDKNDDSQKHPMYPIHWGGWDKNIREFVESEFDNEDPLEGKQVKDTWCYKCQYIIEQCKCNKGSFVTNQFQDDMLYRDAYSGSTQDFFKNTFPPVPKSFPNEFQEETTAENLEDKFDKGEDCLDYFKPYHCPCNMCKHAREENTEKSWEEAASDLALRVVKLENKVEELIILKKSRKAIRL